MTFTVRIRTLPGSPMVVDYECACGVCFEQLVERNGLGDPPDQYPCGDCGADAALVISATKITKYETQMTVINPPGMARKHQNNIPPAAKDAKAMIEGKITRGEWDKRERKRRENRRFKKAIAKGYATKRITVG